MPTIDEIISSAVTQLTTKRSNIRTALQSKYNETIPSSMTFGDVPTYITNVANYQYSLGLADGASSGGGSYVHENNAQLLNSYVATGGQSQHNGTYTKLENTYHRGFNVYKNGYDMYLVCVDDNGNRWQVCTDPSETSYQYKEGSGTSFGPVGSYSSNTSLSLSGTVVISAPGSSSSSSTSPTACWPAPATTPPPASSSSDESSIPSQSSSSGDGSSTPSTSSSSGGGGDSSGSGEIPYGYSCSGEEADMSGYNGAYYYNSSMTGYDNTPVFVYSFFGTTHYLYKANVNGTRYWVLSDTFQTNLSSAPTLRVQSNTSLPPSNWGTTDVTLTVITEDPYAH